jgi:hypothetical protein
MFFFFSGRPSVLELLIQIIEIVEASSGAGNRGGQKILADNGLLRAVGCVKHTIIAAAGQKLARDHVRSVHPKKSRDIPLNGI